MKKEEKKAIRKLIQILTARFDKERNCYIYMLDILGTPWLAFRTLKYLELPQTDRLSDRSSNLARWIKE